MKKRTIDFLMRLNESQMAFLQMRSKRIGYNISKMISLFLRSQYIFQENKNDMRDATASMSSFLNNILQIQRALSFVIYSHDDEDAFLKLKELAKTLHENILKSVHERDQMRNKLYILLSSHSLYLKTDEIQKHEKSLSHNIHLLILDDEKSNRIFHIRLTAEEKTILEKMAKKSKTSMKNIILALVLSGNVFSWKQIACDDKNYLRQNADLLNRIAKFLNTTVKSDEKISELDMLSMISDLNVIDDFMRDDIEHFQNSNAHFKNYLKLQIQDEGVYWTKKFKTRLENGLYGTE